MNIALAFLLLAAPARALTPDQLDPMEKWAYDRYAASDAAAAKAYLDQRSWLRACEAVVLDRSKAAALGERPAGVDEAKYEGKEKAHVEEAVKLRDLARAGKLKPGPKAPAPKPAKLKPATAAFLKELGFDPESAQIRAISGDTIKSKSGEITSLDTLAADRDKNGMKRFVATRSFVPAFLKDGKAPFPPRGVYETSYLKDGEAERIIMWMHQPGGASAGGK